jgi:hypothetical protein
MKKVKKKKGAQWAQVESAGRERECFSFSGDLKPILPHGKAGPGSSHPIMNKWGEAWAVPS